MGSVEQFLEVLRDGSVELFEDNAERMSSGELVPTPNAIDPGDVALFFEGVRLGLITLHRGARFDTQDRPTGSGRWGLLSRSADGGWFNAEYLPQIAAYVDAVAHLGYPSERVLFELPARALQLDLAILDDHGRVVVLGEAKRDVGALTSLREGMLRRFGDSEPSLDSKKRGDEQRQLAWRLWTVRPDTTWLIGPGYRGAFRTSTSPLVLDPLPSLPTARELGLDHRPPGRLAPPDLA
jgi:hypothetical protein